jgi:hypothetical protein
MRLMKKYLLLSAALAFLLAEEIWLGLRAAIAWLVDALPLAWLKQALRRFLEWLPAYPTLFLFLVPLVATEPLKFVSYWLLAERHWLAGVTLYAAIELLRLALVSFVFGISRDKLMSIGWFRVLYGWFMVAHDWAFALVEPYRERLKALARQFRLRFSGRSRLLELAARLRRREARRP